MDLVYALACRLQQRIAYVLDSIAALEQRRSTEVKALQVQLGCVALLFMGDVLIAASLLKCDLETLDTG